MDVGAAFVADAQAPLRGQPGDCSLDDPALAAGTGASNQGPTDYASPARLSVARHRVATSCNERRKQRCWGDEPARASLRAGCFDP